jgi:hypothetical protein
MAQGTASALGGLGDWIQNAAGSGNVPEAYRTPPGSIKDVPANANFTESDLNAIISSIFKVTGSTNNLMLVADTDLRQSVSDFARFGAAGSASF